MIPASSDAATPSVSLRTGFLRSYDRDPSAVAVEVAGESISYGDLHDAAPRLATALGALDARAADEDPETRPPLTAVFGQRSRGVVEGMLGALFRGDGYVPLNPTLPIERTRGMLERSGCRAVVLDEHGEKQILEVAEPIATPLLLVLPHREDVEELAAALPHHRVIGAGELSNAGDHSGHWQPAPVDPDAIAYLLFTPGSTGQPKGVGVAHRNVDAFLTSMAERYSITPQDRLSQTFELTFDLSVFDLFLAWESGARVCMPTQTQKMLPGKYVNESGITVWFSVPSTAVLMSKLRMLTSPTPTRRSGGASSAGRRSPSSSSRASPPPPPRTRRSRISTARPSSRSPARAIDGTRSGVPPRASSVSSRSATPTRAWRRSSSTKTSRSWSPARPASS